MTIQQFHQMNELDKVSAIMQYGRLMAQNIGQEMRTFLYRLDSFYVSACYSKSNDHLEEINCFVEVNQQIPHFRKHLISIHPAERNQPSPEL